MDILIIAHFTQVPGEKGNSRFNYLAKLMAEAGHDVEIVTSSFSHRTKAQREKFVQDDKYKITMCYESGYKKNVSLKRFYSHYIFGKSLKKYLKNRKKPDVIYCAVPSLDAAYVASEYAKKNNIKFIIDVQDLWPEAFKMVFNIPVISDVIFGPMQVKANKIYASADEIIAVSDTYANRALSVNDKVENAHPIYLGTERSKFDNAVKKYPYEKKRDVVYLAYCGTLGHSYDITCVINAMEILKNKNISNVKFLVMGDGPLKGKFEEYAKTKAVDVEFTGRLEYEKMCGMLAGCDIAVNPISHGAAQSIINKHADYAAAGIPVISTQESVEYRQLVDKYHMGFNCKNSDSQDIADKLVELISNKELCAEMGQNARRCYEENFNRENKYLEILDIIECNE